MLTLTPPRTSSHRSHHTGVIGLDIGSHAIKWAQVVRDHSGWQLTAAHVLRVPQPLLTPEAVRGGTIRTVLRSAGLGHFTGRPAVACTLSMALTELRSLDLPAGSPDELRDMAYNGRYR